MATSTATWVDTKPQNQVEEWIKKNGETACAVHGTDDPRFALWLSLVDKAVYRRVHLSYRDLEDWQFHDEYEAGTSPIEAAEYLLFDLGYTDPEADGF